jgi:hypothetical protein
MGRRLSASGPAPRGRCASPRRGRSRPAAAQLEQRRSNTRDKCIRNAGDCAGSATSPGAPCSHPSHAPSPTFGRHADHERDKHESPAHPRRRRQTTARRSGRPAGNATSGAWGRTIPERAEAVNCGRHTHRSLRSPSCGHDVRIPIGAVAIGAVAVGRLVVERLAIGRSRVRRRQIEGHNTRWHSTNDRLPPGFRIARHTAHRAPSAHRASQLR